VRVSTLDQNEKRQLEGQARPVFTDKASGRDTAKPQLNELLRFARDGDIAGEAAPVSSFGRPRR
jgi:DNA invertase Pin-like site-specific DNA recombinase